MIVNVTGAVPLPDIKGYQILEAIVASVETKEVLRASI